MHSINLSRPYILYVEDDADDVELLQHALAGTEFDFQLVHHTNAVDALEFLERSKRFNRLPELIFLDINMARMDGRETLVCLKADKDIARIPLTILSTSTLDSDRNYFGRYHIPYIVKPGDVNQFKSELLEVMSGLLSFDTAEKKTA
ncbi:MAG TPA: response regulator [Chitinophagaceae bacterium]